MPIPLDYRMTATEARQMQYKMVNIKAINCMKRMMEYHQLRAMCDWLHTDQKKPFYIYASECMRTQLYDIPMLYR